MAGGWVVGRGRGGNGERQSKVSTVNKNVASEYGFMTRQRCAPQKTEHHISADSGWDAMLHHLLASIMSNLESEYTESMWSIAR